MDNQGLVDPSHPSVLISKLDLDKGKQKVSGTKIDDKKIFNYPKSKSKVIPS